MEVALDPEAKAIRGTLWLDWKNTSGVALDRFPFHLYLNAFQNNRSTFFREAGYEVSWPVANSVPDDYWGYIEVHEIRVESPAELEVTGTEFIQPDGGNAEDQTVWSVRLNAPLAPGSAVRFRMEFTSKLPRGIARTGWVDDYFFAAQWFPKIGVWEEGGWNCHQYHAVTEYYADFGVYDVALTVPPGYVVGATGRRLEEGPGEDDGVRYRYVQADVHDFAWVAGRRLVEKRRLFSHPELPVVEMFLLLQPEHLFLEDRYFRAMESGLRYFGEWFGAYPHATLTLVDPAWGSDTDGMEYPTFITGGANRWAPESVLSPEGVTVHEVGHQWFQGMVANNEFEEAWLDEGLNSWAEARVQREVYEPSRFLRRFFGPLPFVVDSVTIPFETAGLADLRAAGRFDVMARAGWEYRDFASYRVNSYRKPEIILWTLERMLGGERMLAAVRAFFQRFRYRHPSGSDFMETLSEVSGEDLSEFFRETIFSDNLVDYAVVSARSESMPVPEGFFETAESGSHPDRPFYLTEVLVERKGGARLPVDVLMVFEKGVEIRRRWDGRNRWQRYRVESPNRLRYAVVDPQRVLLLDVDPVNNSRWAASERRIAAASWKWTSRWMFWVQNLLETFAFAG